MNNLNKSNVYDVFELIARFSKIFGMAPYSVKKESYSSNFNLGIYGFLNCIPNLIICTVMPACFANLILARQENQFYSKVNIILCVLSSLRILSATITIIVMFFKQDVLISAYEKLKNFDVKRENFEQPKYSKYQKGVIFAICLIFVLVLGVELIYYYVEEEAVTVLIYDLFSNGLQFLIHLLVLLYFELYVIILRNDFKFITQTTKNLSTSLGGNEQSSTQTLVVVKTISLMYDDLCKGADYINQVFSFPLFSLISLNFMEVLLGIYLLQDATTRNVRGIFWTIFYTLQQFFILTPPASAQDEAKEITKYFSEAELQVDQDLSNARNHFLLRTLHQSVNFSACGFFPISMSAIIGQFSISISFLLFMFQIIK